MTTRLDHAIFVSENEAHLRSGQFNSRSATKGVALDTLYISTADHTQPPTSYMYSEITEHDYVYINVLL